MKQAGWIKATRCSEGVLLSPPKERPLGLLKTTCSGHSMSIGGQLSPSPKRLRISFAAGPQAFAIPSVALPFDRMIVPLDRFEPRLALVARPARGHW